jgi:hypothetical protein
LDGRPGLRPNRNDRLIAAATAWHRYAESVEMRDLASGVLAEIEYFFLVYNAQKGRFQAVRAEDARVAARLSRAVASRPRPANHPCAPRRRSAEANPFGSGTAWSRGNRSSQAPPTAYAESFRLPNQLVRWHDSRQARGRRRRSGFHSCSAALLARAASTAASAWPCSDRSNLPPEELEARVGIEQV